MNARTDLKLGIISGPFHLPLHCVVEGRPLGSSGPSDVFQKYNRKFTASLSTVLFILVPTVMKLQLITRSKRNLILYFERRFASEASFTPSIAIVSFVGFVS